MAARATNQPSDKQQAVPMVEEAIGNVGTALKEVSADAGYYSAKAVEELYAMGVDPLIAPEKTRHGWVPPPAPRGRERYALRMETVEPMFGQIKQGRGFRQFLLRGLEKVNGEWSLICTGHNLLKLFRFGTGIPAKGGETDPATASGTPSLLAIVESPLNLPALICQRRPLMAA